MFLKWVSSASIISQEKKKDTHRITALVGRSSQEEFAVGSELGGLGFLDREGRKATLKTEG